MAYVVGPKEILNKTLTSQYSELDQNGVIIATYIWLDGTTKGLRGKSKTVSTPPKSPADLPVWNFDGSSTYQSSGENSDVYIKPVAIFDDPFLRKPNVLVLCECLDKDEKPVPSNKRSGCNEAMVAAKDFKPWFGIEQEYMLLDIDDYPLGWPKTGYPGPQGPYYCGIGYGKAPGRDIMEAHMKCCLYAGIKVSGTNSEVMPAQWEYQVGPCEGIDMGDQLWVSRYILERITEEYGVKLTYDPKPVAGDWNGTAGHCNYSTLDMRTPGKGMDAMMEAIKKFEGRHQLHIRSYGEGNERRLTGKHETAPIDKFCWGIASRMSSIRIPRQTAADGYGYLEDRRPAGNTDPYVVTELIVRTTCLNETSNE